MKATEDIFRAYDIRGVYGEELDAEIKRTEEDWALIAGHDNKEKKDEVK